ncbi:hypothetical protein [Bacillus salipaludis]|uniref:Uncharacterized protein n=1 Tax=Bacillus salipaludis TaxID=2547811 RepID=A0ABW8RG57_9BACI
MKKKGPFDLKQRQTQKIYKEELKLKESDNSFFLIVCGCFIMLLPLIPLTYNFFHP